MEINVYESNGASAQIARVYFGKTPPLMRNWKNVYSATLETGDVLAFEKRLIKTIGDGKLNYRDFTPNFSDIKKSDLGLGFSGVAAEELSELVRRTFNL